jgi:hypothetical protein
MRQSRVRFTARRMLVAAAILAAAGLAWSLWPGPGASWRAYARLRVGMSERGALEVLGTAPDSEGRLSGRDSGLDGPGPGPPRWYRFRVWESPEITIAVYSDATSGRVVRCDAIPGPGSGLKWWTARLRKWWTARLVWGF